MPSSSDLSPVKKRPRTASVSDVDGSNKWKRHPVLYMQDGTMVLLSNNTLFRIYHGLLSTQSEVFRGMASLAEHQPPDAETYDGCPLVRMTDDAQDLAYFLETTMGLKQFHVKEPISFPRAAAILRLSTKYIVPQLRQHAIGHFSRLIPKNFYDIWGTESSKQVFGKDPPHPFELISLFREMQLTRFLPWAFYLACMTVPNELAGSGISNQNMWGKFVNMAPEDSHIVLRGWIDLCKENRDLRRNTIKYGADYCNSDECDDNLYAAWIDSIHDDIESDVMTRWELFDQLLGDPDELEELCDKVPLPCEECRDGWLTEEEESRRQVWDKLPEIFSLPSWDELQ